MRRRDFISLVGASVATATLPRAAFAQQAAKLPGALKRVGFLTASGNPDGSLSATSQASFDAMRAGLKEEGFIEETNLTVDVRVGLNDVSLTRAAAHDLAGGGYDLLFGGGTGAVAALVAETKTIPIVFAGASDPVGDGFVQSLARPGGNVTGMANIDASMGGKWLEMLHQVAPGVWRAVMMFNPDVAPGGGHFLLPSFQAAARALGIEPVVAEVRTLPQIDAEVADMGKAPGTGLVTGFDGYTLQSRRTLIDAVARENLPAVVGGTGWVEEGSLISYGSDLPDTFRQAGRYAGLVLKGARPSDLPVQAPTTLLLSVNLKTARAQGITIPPSLVALADTVIE